MFRLLANKFTSLLFQQQQPQTTKFTAAAVCESTVQMINVRTRTTCSRSNGKERTVKTAMERCFRLYKRVWIRLQPGFHRRMYHKPLEKRFISQQHVLCSRRESYVLEKMAGPEYRSIDAEKFVDPPFSYYHQFIRQIKSEKDKFHVFP